MKISCLLATLTLALTNFAEAKLSVLPGNQTGIYAAGETITWTVAVTEPAPAASYVIKQDGGKILRQGMLDLQTGSAEITIRCDEPGVLLADVDVGGGDSPKLHATGGAAVEAGKIPRSAPRPEDFDEFWETHLDELAKTPPHPSLTAAAESKKPGVQHWQLTMDLPRGQKMLAQLARPEAEGKRPAMVIFQYAGVYPLPPAAAISKAAEGWLVLNVSAHELPLEEPVDFYKDQFAGPLKDYMAIGNDDREKSYFLRMFLACSRAVDYLASRPDWDGKTLVVTGTSQGGLQSIVAAGLNPKVTAVVVNVPAGCDATAPLAGRAMPWPFWLREIPGKSQDALVLTCGYFDAVNFASRVKCPALVSFGLLDRVATASGVNVMISELRGPVEKVVMPASDHHGGGGSQAAYQQRSAAWFKSILTSGQPPLP